MLRFFHYIQGKGGMTLSTKYIDISYWQHSLSVDDFKKVKADGISGIIFRSSYTSQNSFTLNEDSVFVNNIHNAHKAGIKNIGVYHYSQAISVEEAEREARFCLKQVKEFKKWINIGIYFDFEFGGRLNSTKAKSLGKSKCTDICNAFAKVVKDAGYGCGTYASMSVLEYYLNHKKLMGNIWVAQYNSRCTFSGDYAMWQYTSSGKVNGISGRVDMNYVYKDLDSTKTVIDKTKEILHIKKKYKGEFPTLPKRGYFIKGDKNNNVELLQKYLNWYKDFDLEVDGDLGELTRNAVKTFQKAEGLEVDGKFGKKSLAKAKTIKR